MPGTRPTSSRCVAMTAVVDPCTGNCEQVLMNPGDYHDDWVTDVVLLGRPVTNAYRFSTTVMVPECRDSVR
jgi:hypothetical protein